MTTIAPTLDVQRELFEIPEGIACLNCASMGPQLRAVDAAGMNSVRRRRVPWTLSTERWFSGSERLRELFAQIIGADANGIAIVPSVS